MYSALQRTPSSASYAKQADDSDSQSSGSAASDAEDSTRSLINAFSLKDCIMLSGILVGTVILFLAIYFSIMWFIYWLFMWMYPSTIAFFAAVPQTQALPYCPPLLQRPLPSVPYRGQSYDEECFNPVCGLVTPSKTSNLTESYFAGSDRNVSSYENLTDSCRSIIEFDRATRTSAAECVEWCNQQTQNLIWPSLYCYRRKTTGRVVRTACVKARVANFFSFIPEEIHPYAAYLAGVIYSFIGLAIAAIKSRGNDAHDEVVNIDEQRCARQCGPLTILTQDGPFKDGKLEGPWSLLKSCFPVTNDQEGSLWMLYTRIPAMLLESFLDFTSFASYLLYGEPIYAAISFLTMAVVGDPMQVKAFSHLEKSMKRRFATKKLWQAVGREGVRDGGAGACLALQSLMQASFEESNPLSFAIVRLLSLFYGVLVVIPKGTEAVYLLMLAESRTTCCKAVLGECCDTDSDMDSGNDDGNTTINDTSPGNLNINNYYDVVEARRKLPTDIKYLYTNLLIMSMVNMAMDGACWVLAMLVLLSPMSMVIRLYTIARKKRWKRACVLGTIFSIGAAWPLLGLWAASSTFQFVAFQFVELDMVWDSFPSQKDIASGNVIAISKFLIILSGAIWALLIILHMIHAVCLLEEDDLDD